MSTNENERTRLADLVAELTTAQQTKELVDRLWSTLPEEKARELALSVVTKIASALDAGDYTFKRRFEDVCMAEIRTVAVTQVGQKLVELEFEQKLRATVDEQVRRFLAGELNRLILKMMEDVRQEIARKMGFRW